MSVLPAGQSLRQYLPNLDEFLADPRTYLQAGAVVVGPRQVYGLAALFGVPGLAFLVSCLAGHADGERLAMGIGLLAGAAVWLGWSLWLRGHELVLLPDGVEVVWRNTVVWVPWSVFHSEGQALGPAADSPLVGLALPINPQALPFVELRKDGYLASQGAEVNGPQWQFRAPDEVVLPARYAIAAGELGRLLLLLGQRLGRELPTGTPPRSAYPGQEKPPIPDRAGWVCVPLTRLQFPPECCSCGRAANDVLHTPVYTVWDRCFGMFLTTFNGLELSVPVCRGCLEEVRQRQRRWGLLGLLAGGLLGGAGAVGLVLAGQDFAPSTLLIAELGGFGVGSLAGFVIGTLFGVRLPVQVRRYSPVRGTVSLRFRHPGYAARVGQQSCSRHEESNPQSRSILP